MATRQACNTTTLHDDDGMIIDSSNSTTSADIYRWSDVNVGSECNEIIGAADRRKSVRETMSSDAVDRRGPCSLASMQHMFLMSNYTVLDRSSQGEASS